MGFAVVIYRPDGRKPSGLLDPLVPISIFSTLCKTINGYYKASNEVEWEYNIAPDHVHCWSDHDFLVDPGTGEPRNIQKLLQQLSSSLYHGIFLLIFVRSPKESCQSVMIKHQNAPNIFDI